MIYFMTIFNYFLLSDNRRCPTKIYIPSSGIREAESKTGLHISQSSYYSSRSYHLFFYIVKLYLMLCPLLKPVYSKVSFCIKSNYISIVLPIAYIKAVSFCKCSLQCYNILICICNFRSRVDYY